jgi:hypothetical protein
MIVDGLGVESAELVDDIVSHPIDLTHTVVVVRAQRGELDVERRSYTYRWLGVGGGGFWNPCVSPVDSCTGLG